MPRKALLIVIGVIVAILFLGSAIYFFRNSSPAPNSESPTLGDLKSSIPTTNKVTVPSGAGNLVVNNFLKQHGAVENGYTEFFANDDYALGYDGPSHTFLINTFALTEPQFQSIRTNAEAKLLSLLGIDQQAACTLTVKINNFRADDESISYKTFPLSFCSNQ